MSKVTIKDIAKICDVSYGTVDRAINKRPGISFETNRKIMDAVKKLNYRPDRIAQSLARGRTMSIGLVCFDLTNNFIANLVDVFESVAKKSGYFISLVLSHGNKKDEREGIDYLLERKVDGIVIFPVGYGDEYVQYIKNLRTPVVSIYNRISSDIPYVGIDARAAMKNAVDHIARCGYSRIILINSTITDKILNNTNVYTLLERQKGYMEGLEEFKLNREGPLIIEGLDFKRIDQLLNNSSEKTAFLCICDMFALELLEHIKKNGLSVPDDIGIMGFDNVSTLEYVSPRIATISYDVEAMGKRAFEILMDIIAEKEDIEVDNRLSYSIIEGASL